MEAQEEAENDAEVTEDSEEKPNKKRKIINFKIERENRGKSANKIESEPKIRRQRLKLLRKRQKNLLLVLQDLTMLQMNL